MALITRSHTKGDAPSTAVYSGCERYRYSLTRVWDSAAPRVMFVMLNPSTATEVQNDPTVERCERRARVLGFGGFRVTNIFAFRATDPRDMRAAADPIGPDNDSTLDEGADWADRIIAAWGVHGAHQDRGVAVAARLSQGRKPIYHLGLSKAGHPKHPLYLPYSQEPVPWQVESAMTGRAR
ncbi:DUF1643 domain-containing protein [Sulfitobacter sp. S0837]|uniref:DUF1643 domain-containing protein n=1 Tax=Sulfitobacter maritimus TaxID=2741719 RepID=UPI0015843AF5|nr:DUF1643 domain-containing protein [Sulfitobacter maritimus]NUH65377.1 DUF1643 domain-containing protein [Sulfitobacter maritimus]